MPKKIDKKICLLIAVAVLFAGALIWSAFFWQFGKIRTLSNDIQKKQLDSLVHEERSRKVLELGKKLDDIDERQKEISAVFIDKNDAVPFLRALESVASATGNSIKITVTDLSKMKSQTAKKIATQEPDNDSVDSVKQESQAKKKTSSQSAKQNFSNQLGFSVELMGQFHSLVDFLTKLENMPYLVRVYDFQLTPIVKTGAVQSSVQGSGDGQPEEITNSVKTILTISVYTNGAK